MTTRERILTVLLGITGIVAAGAITLAANSISGHEIGLSAQPVSLAATQAPPKPAPAVEAEDREDRSGSDEPGEIFDDSGTGSGDDAPSSSGPGGGDRDGDRHGDRSGTSGISGTSGSGSGNSGPGSETTTVEDSGGSEEPEVEDHSGPGS